MNQSQGYKNIIIEKPKNLENHKAKHVEVFSRRKALTNTGKSKPSHRDFTNNMTLARKKLSLKKLLEKISHEVKQPPSKKKVHFDV